jgi:hypothetical protein
MACMNRALILISGFKGRLVSAHSISDVRGKRDCNEIESVRSSQMELMDREAPSFP